MGCWNQTCGLTQIHIRAGEKVMIFPLSQSIRDSLCYTTPFWTPFPLPFYGEYNDYGAAESTSGIGLKVALDEIQRKLVEVEQGDNQYHDIPVKKDAFDESVFWEAIHEQRLKVVGWRDKQHEIGMVMIKQSVFDYLADNYQLEDYDYDNATGSTYYKYTLHDVLADLPALVDCVLAPTAFDSTFKEAVAAGEDPDKIEKLCRSLRRHDPIIHTAGEMNRDDVGKKKRRDDGFNRAAHWLQHYESHLAYGGGISGSSMINNTTAALIEANDRVGLVELLSEHLKMLFIDAIMLHTRKFWSPQAGAGSQSCSHSGYRALAAASIHVLDEEKAEWDAMDSDE